jgi:serine/threonine-protein kinase HipA
MKRAKVFVDGIEAGELQELELGKHYRFVYKAGFEGPSVSLEMPLTAQSYEYSCFPPFFEGLLPEGIMLEGLLRQVKIDRNDLMSQLIAVGADLVGNVTIEAIND